MDFQTMISNAVDKMRQEELKVMPVLSLGELIAKLEAIPLTYTFREGEEAVPVTVSYDFEYLYPTKLDSWRGVYAELALGFDHIDNGECPTLENLLEELRSAIGKTFQGYKGGEFTMGRTTPVWVANYGNAGQTGIVNVFNNDYQVVLITQYMRD